MVKHMDASVISTCKTSEGMLLCGSIQIILKREPPFERQDLPIITAQHFNDRNVGF